MNCSVTNIVPNMDNQSKISGSTLQLSYHSLSSIFLLQIFLKDIISPVKRQELLSI